MKTHWLLALFCHGSLAVAAGDTLRGALPAPGDLQTIAALDLPRYLGRWYEIAKYPNSFQKKCAGGTTADYSFQNDGRVQVINRCRRENGEIVEAIGAARQVGAATSAKLQVRFAPEWLSFLPFVWGDYWVIDLDEAYRLVAVSEPNKEYLWILARSPRVDPAEYRDLLLRLSERGFDLNRLEVTRQD